MGAFLINWLANVPVTAVPYALAALGLIISERSGVLNLTAEGLMLVGALAGIGASLTLGGHPGIALARGDGGGERRLAAVRRHGGRAARQSGHRRAVDRVLLPGPDRPHRHRDGLAEQAMAGLGQLHIWPLSEIPAVGRILFVQDAVVYLTRADLLRASTGGSTRR